MGAILGVNEGRCNRKKAGFPAAARLGEGSLVESTALLRTGCWCILSRREREQGLIQRGVLLLFIVPAVLAVRRFRIAGGTSYAASVDTGKHTGLVSRESSREPADERVGLYPSGSR